ncbi:DEAD/DEAH box helicase [Acidipila sp. EB88]|uniref:DEAD/DEAH box helicase n=1 Tax=Acidipila sp. EB88 TaxID=2305226 RepID=UPI000F5FFB64|nr:DEAD/DEAH box helicase [Acidipila sp. EB88]RRA47432.1 DEAD/DEAH box helicase [Acidipila sp. EB88]
MTDSMTPPVTAAVTQFVDFAISETLKKRITACNFITPTPVQAGAIPPALEGKDILATAQTGTGKTLSFLLPIIEKLEEVKATRGAAALILLPTRELAMQVEKAFRQLTTGISVALVVGGVAEGPQIEALRRGARLIVATPGRLEDYIGRRLVKLEGIRILVLDEVDRMLDMGFKPAIRRIADCLPQDRQTLCYSATLDNQIKEVVRDYLKNPVRIEIGSVLKPSENVELQAFEVDADSKLELLQHLLRSETGSFIVFVRTKHGADRIAMRLERAGIEAARIHGDRTQAQRNAALRSFSQGRQRVLVATDVAARGIDVAHVAHVVNYDMPKEAEDFVHRVGRTGRAASKGIASTFTTPNERGDLRKIERQLNIKIKRFRVRPNGGAGVTHLPENIAVQPVLVAN